MSAKKQQRTDGVKLPLALRKELDLPSDRAKKNQSARYASAIAERKEARRAARSGQRPSKPEERSKTTVNTTKIPSPSLTDGGSKNGTKNEARWQKRKADETRLADYRSAQEANHTSSRKGVAPGSLQSIPVPRKQRTSSPSASDFESDTSRASSPGLVLDASSRSFRDAAAQEDARIAKLERLVGKRKKSTKDTDDPMLDFLLDGLDEELDGRKRSYEGKEWLEAKRRKVNTSAHESDGNDEEVARRSFYRRDRADKNSNDTSSETELEMAQNFSNDDDNNNETQDSDDSSTYSAAGDEDNANFYGFESDEDRLSVVPAVKKVRENPYIAPVKPGTIPTKYVPPSLRKPDGNGDQSLVHLRRQVQGQLNKLSEANLISILNEFEKLYQTNPRQDVTAMLIDVLLVSFCNRSTLSNTFIILHAAFISAVYKVIGVDFGAELLNKLVERFDQEYQSGIGKETLNLISLLANLFIFNVISSIIVYDYIRVLLADFGEQNAELLLRVVRDCGPQLRSDDPTALKEIVLKMQKTSSEMVQKGEKLNVRTRVMMDAITDLKNNKTRDATINAGSTGEHITRMRKALGSLNSRNLRATEPMRLSRADLENSEKKGKWWLVGASWKGNEAKEVQFNFDLQQQHDQTASYAEPEIDLLTLAKQYRMNTDIRRSIFVAIMSAEDWRDAQMRIAKLRLTSKQEQEIAKVLVRCVRAEPAYNGYYALLAKQLCKENRKLKMSLQFSLWEFFRTIGENDDGEDDDVRREQDQDVKPSEIVNVAKMFAHLVYQGVLALGILKILNIGYLHEQATLFLEVFLISIMTQAKAKDEELLKVFQKSAESPQVIKSLQYFIKKHVKRSDLPSKREKPQVKEGCKLADVAFQTILSSAADGE